MTFISQDSWNSSSPVPHFTPLKSAEYLTDPAVIRAYERLHEPPEDGIRFVRRVCRSLHFSIWIRSVAWSCSLLLVIAISFNAILQMDYRMQSLISPQTAANSDDEHSDGSTKTLAIPTESEERLASDEKPVIR